MRFLVDENLPVALATWLAEKGFDAQHTKSVGLNAASDPTIAKYARRLGAVVVSKDRDYLTFGRNEDGPQVVRLRLGNMSTRALLEVCSRAWPDVVVALRTGERIVELRQHAASS